METVVAEPEALLHVVRTDQLDALMARVGRLILSPTTVERLVESGAINVLAESEWEPRVEVVSLTQGDAARVEALLAGLGEGEPESAHAAAEAVALMHRTDLAAGALLAVAPVATRLAEASRVRAVSVGALLRDGAAPDPAPDPLTLTLDAETRARLDNLVARGVGVDAHDVVRRAIRGLHSALEH